MKNDKKLLQYTVDDKPIISYKGWTFILADSYLDTLYNNAIHHYILEITPPNDIIDILNETYSYLQINDAKNELQQVEDYLSADEDEKIQMMLDYLSDSILTPDSITARKELLKKHAREVTYFEEVFPFLVCEATGCMFNALDFDVFYDEIYDLPGSKDVIHYYELTADMTVSDPYSYEALMSKIRTFNMTIISTEYTSIKLSGKRYRISSNVYDIGDFGPYDKVVNYCATITILNYRLPNDMTAYKNDVTDLVYKIYDNIINSNPNLDRFIKLHHLNKNIFGFSAYYDYNKNGSMVILLLIKPFRIGDTVFDSIGLSSIKIHKEFPNDLVNKEGQLIDITDSYNYNELLWAFIAKDKSIVYFLNSSETTNFTRNNKTGAEIISIFGTTAGFGELPIKDSPTQIYPIEEINRWDNFRLFRIPKGVQVPDYMRMYNNDFISVNPYYIEENLVDFEINSSDVRDIIIEGISQETNILNIVGIKDKSDFYNRAAVIRFLCVYDGWYLFSIFTLGSPSQKRTSSAESILSKCIRNTLSKMDSSEDERWHELNIEGEDYDF